MFAIHEISCFQGGRQVLRDVSFRAQAGEKIAIVGPNGAGKTSLLRIVSGELTPDSGTVSKGKTAQIGYVAQEIHLDSQRLLRDELLGVFDSIRSHFDEMATLEERMGHDLGEEDFERVSERYDVLQSEIQRLDGYSIEARVGETAAGLGFSVADLDRPCSEFSGGWRHRIQIAKTLLRRPDILLLDEPTNHLDLESMIWLEDWIRSSKASVAMVSHERAFMDRLADGIVELAAGAATFYRGNYTDYLAQREERREHQQRSYDNQQLKIRELEKFIARFRANASKASLVQSRRRQLEKMERIVPPPADSRVMRFNFPPPERANKEMIALRGAAKSYGDLEVLKPFDFTLFREERIALVGLNGAGKSTLMRLLAGLERLSHGERAVGVKTKIEYFEQFQSDLLDSDRTVLDEMNAVAPPGQTASARDILGAFLFRENDVVKPIRVLSGGEKTRLRLARMLFSRTNCLLLDEPTNHLDLPSRLALEKALLQFKGSVVLVSHDRFFLDRIATRVIEIRDGNLVSFPGNYSDYLNATGGHGFLPRELGGSLGVGPQAGISATGLYSANEDSASEPGRPAQIIPTPGAAEAGQREAALDESSAGALSKSERIVLRDQRKKAARRRKMLERDIKRLESEVANLERTMESLHRQMAQPDIATAPNAMRELMQDQKQTKNAIKKAYGEWERHAEELEKIDQT